MPKLILFSGPPGVGKSTLSYRLAKDKHFTLLTRDQIDRSLERLGIENKDAGYEVIMDLAKLNLQNNISVVLDATFTINEARSSAIQTAAETKAMLYIIVCICSDIDLWKQRIESRPEVVEGWTPADWIEAQRVLGNYEKWDNEHLVLDSVDPIEKNYQKLLKYIL